MIKYTSPICLLLLQSLDVTFSFLVPPSHHASSTRLYSETLKRPRSTVEDPDGPTPEILSDEPEVVDPDDIPELAEITSAKDLSQPIPHQPWRRGETAGCEDPIAAPWQREAEEIIYKAAGLVGGQVLDVTWFLTQVLVTIDDDVLPTPVDLMGKAAGPVIDIIEPASPVYQDPTDPDPEPIWADEDDILYQRETPEEAEEAMERKNNMYAAKDSSDPADEPHIQDEIYKLEDDVPLYVNEETRDDISIRVTEEEQLRSEELEEPMDIETITINTAGISVVAGAIVDALKTVEDELRILQRHEVLLASPGPEDVIETQRQFDAYRDTPVIVETQDPFESNRTLKGRLVDRNSMDLMINQQGRLVTIPLNFVKCVRIPPQVLNQMNDDQLEEGGEDDGEYEYEYE